MAPTSGNVMIGTPSLYRMKLQLHFHSPCRNLSKLLARREGVGETQSHGTRTIFQEVQTIRCNARKLACKLMNRKEIANRRGARGSLGLLPEHLRDDDRVLFLCCIVIPGLQNVI